MKHLKIMAIMFLAIIFTQWDVNACTIVAVAGRATADGRPLLLKNRDSSADNVIVKIGTGSQFVYLSHCNPPNGDALSGYNETGFSIVSSRSFNMPNSNYWWNAYIMQLALESCSTVDEFEDMLDSLPKPIAVCANYGVMDAQGNVAIFEVSAYTYVRYDADSADNGYLIRTNFSFSQDTTVLSAVEPSSIPRYQIASTYLEEALLSNGYLTKDDLCGLSRCLINSDGIDLRDNAPFDENTYTSVDFRYYIPHYKSTSAMVIQGLLPNEHPKLTIAWTIVGPPMASTMVPYLITPQNSLPQKAQLGSSGRSWLCSQGQLLKNSCFVNSTTLDLAKLYNQANTGVMQKIMCIENDILEWGNGLVDSLRSGTATGTNVAAYYSWIDNYLDSSYSHCIYGDSCECTNNVVDSLIVHDTCYVYVHDTIVIVDTVVVDHYIHDTITHTEYVIDSTTVFDTVFVDYYLYDTLLVVEYEVDTVSVLDTLWLTLCDTVWLIDTVYIHDTIYITPNGIDEAFSENIILYQRYGGIVIESANGSVLPQIAVYDINGRLIGYHADCDEPKWYIMVPSSGVYLVKVSQYPIRKIVIAK